MKKRLALSFLAIVLIAALGIFLTPVATRGGIRAWIWWRAHQQGLKVEIGAIEAPFRGPVTLDRVVIVSARECESTVSFSCPKMVLDLNFRGLLPKARVRAIRHLTLANPEVTILRHNHPDKDRSNCRVNWPTLQSLLPDAFSISGLNLTVQSGDVTVRLRDVSITASELDSGQFSARNIELSSPAFHQRFDQLRGATSWQESRLTLGALALARGLDIESLAIDFAHLAKRKLTLDLRLDAFGGKVVASVKGHAGGSVIDWDAAGSASQISLAQTSGTLDLAERVAGSIRACKFTFRGTSQDLAGATASVWAEASGFRWGNRAADTIVLGASLFNRRVLVEQLYIKQHENEVTLNGETLLPATAADWLHPDFQGTVAASINDLGAFARLVGESVEHFAGQLSLTGALNTHERNLGGRVAVQGRQLALFGVPFDSLKATLNLRGSEIGLEGVELHRKTDFLLGDGTVNLAANHRYSGRLNAAILNLADYVEFIPAQWLPAWLGGGVSLEWSGDGASDSDSGAFHLIAARAHSLDGSGPAPIDADLEGTYSPQHISFTKFQLSNDRAAFSALVTTSPGLLQIQSLHFTLNGRALIEGKFTLPIDPLRLRETGSVLAALDEGKPFDVALAVTGLDLAEFDRLLGLASKAAGDLDAKISLAGPLNALTGLLDLHLKNFAPQAQPSPEKDVSLELHLAYDGTLAGGQGEAAVGGDCVKFQATLPVEISKERLQNGRVLQLEKDFSASVETAGLDVSRWPDYLPRGILRAGFFAGRLAFANTLRRPQIVGEMEMREVALETPARLPAMSHASAQVTFDGESARSDRLLLTLGDVPFAGSVVFNFRDPDALQFDYSLGNADLAAGWESPSGNLISTIAIESGGPNELSGFEPTTPSPLAARFLGSLFSSSWSMTLAQESKSLTLFYTPKQPDDGPKPEQLIGITPSNAPISRQQTPDAINDFLGAAQPDFRAIPLSGFTLRFR